MKKLLFTIALSGLIFTSCSNDEGVQQTQEYSKKELGEANPAFPSSDQIKEAESTTQNEVYSQVVNWQTAEPNVKFCKHDPFTNSSGSGYAEVTLKDGSVHYTYFTWLHDSLGKVYVAVLYEGTVPSKNSGC